MSDNPFSKDKLMGLAHGGGSGPTSNALGGGSVLPNIVHGRFAQAAQAALPGVDHFQFVSRGKAERRLRIARFTGQERVNETYLFDIEARSPFELDPLQTLEEEIIGHPGSLLMFDGNVTRAAHGIVTGYGASDARDSRMPRIRLVIEPRLALTKLRVGSRIYQNLSVPEIVKSMLDEWKIAHTFELSGQYTPRAYATQFQESDFDFIRRLAAREGIFFYFRQGADADHEQLVFADDASYKPVAEVSTIHFTSGVSGERGLLEMGVQRKVTPLAARMSDYDFRNPRLPMRELKVAPPAPGVLGDMGSDRFSLYLPRHEAEHEASPSAKRRDVDAQRTLDSLTVDTIVADGVSRVRALTPAHTFVADGHPIASINASWVVIGVRHEGYTPEYGEASSDEVYKNEFQAAPDATPLRMSSSVRRRMVESTQTATVVGASDGEVFTDSLGRIKVQFHWDLDGQNDEHSSCWIRVSQPWTGAGFGVQFLPRVGSEVVVSFLDGDPDRPLVVGSVYNGTNPTPFGLPASRTRSGIRTMSTPGGTAGNELSFDDQQGQEQLYLKAHKNLDTDVGGDHTLKVEGNSNTRVEGHLTENVSGTHTTTVVGGQTTLVTLHKTTQVLGDVIHAVRGDTDERVSGDKNLRVQGVDRAELAERDTLVWGDSVLRVEGHLNAIVGKESAHRSAALHVQGEATHYSTGVTELVSDSSIVFRVGKSSIRIGPDRIELSSPAVSVAGDAFEMASGGSITMAAKGSAVITGDRINVSSKKASLALHEDANLGGDHVNFSNHVEKPEVAKKTHPLTTIRMVDENGAPAAQRRFVVVTATGERSGVLDQNGEATLEIESALSIYFPDVDKARLA